MKNRALLMAAMLACMSFFASAQGKIYLKVLGANEQILGEVKDVGYINQIGVLSYSMGISSCASGQKAKAGNCPPVISDLSFMIQMDRSVNPLKKMLLMGEVARSMVFTMTKSSGDGQKAYYKIRMDDVIITSIQESGAGDVPSVSISIKGGKVAWGYAMQKNDGSFEPFQTFGWDNVKNIPWDVHL